MLDELPDDLLVVHVLSRLRWRTLVVAGAVSRRLERLARDPSPWRTVHLEYRRRPRAAVRRGPWPAVGVSWYRGGADIVENDDATLARDLAELARRHPSLTQLDWPGLQLPVLPSAVRALSTRRWRDTLQHVRFVVPSRYARDERIAERVAALLPPQLRSITLLLPHSVGLIAEDDGPIGPVEEEQQQWEPRGDGDALLAALARRLPLLEGLTVDGRPSWHGGLLPLLRSRAPHLRELHISGSAATDLHFDAAAQAELSDDVLPQMRRLRSLLLGNGASDAIANALPYMPSLTSLTLDWVEDVGALLTGATTLPALRSFTWRGYGGGEPFAADEWRRWLARHAATLQSLAVGDVSAEYDPERGARPPCLVALADAAAPRLRRLHCARFGARDDAADAALFAHQTLLEDVGLGGNVRRVLGCRRDAAAAPCCRRLRTVHAHAACADSAATLLRACPRLERVAFDVVERCTSSACRGVTWADAFDAAAALRGIDVSIASGRNERHPQTTGAEAMRRADAGEHYWDWRRAQDEDRRRRHNAWHQRLLRRVASWWRLQRARRCRCRRRQQQEPDIAHAYW